MTTPNSPGDLPQYPYAGGNNPYGQHPTNPYGQPPIPYGHVQPDPYANPYGPAGAPSYYQPLPDAGPEPVRPVTVVAAFWAWVITAALSLLNLYLIFQSDSWEVVLEATGDFDEISGATAEDLIQVAKTLSIAMAIIFVALYLFFAAKMLTGRNWARIVLTILAGIGVFSALMGMAAADLQEFAVVDSAPEIPPYLSGGLALIALLLMYMPASNTYFRLRKERNRLMKMMPR